MAQSSDIVLGSLIGDALALGPHWVYDQQEIRRKLGRISNYQSPISSYHPGKAAGENTHYGDQTLVLLGSIARTSRFNLAGFAADWRKFWEDPSTVSYRDGATKATLSHLHSGSSPASTSSDIAGAGRIGPLFPLKWDSEEELLLAAKSQTAFTHGDPAVIESALFFARVVLAVQAGKPIPDAISETMTTGDWRAIPEGWLESAKKSAASDSTDAEALDDHGLSCHVGDAFPGICHLLVRYPNDPATALIENACAGGDSAARGMILGLVYGAAFPVSGWPAEWLTDLSARAEAEELIRQLS